MRLNLITQAIRILSCNMAEILINDLTPRNQYTATASQTAFDYDFPIFDQEHLIVQKTLASDGTTSTLTLTTGYTVSSVGAEAGGTVTLVTGAAVGDIITITRDVPVKRITDFTIRGDFKAPTVNREFDLIVMMLQELELDLQRAFILKSEDTTSTIELPVATSRASKLLGFDANGDVLMTSGTGSVTISSAMTPVVQALTLAAARTAFGMGNYEDIKHNHAATVAPTTGDDDGDGYSVGSRWVNVTAGDVYICEDATTGAAVWLQVDFLDLLTLANTWTLPQRGKAIADTDGSFDMDASQDFTWIPTGADELTFTNITVGQSGYIKLENPSAHAITINASTVEAPDDAATELSTAGTYMISYSVPFGETKALIEVSRALS